jgi:hypothetical protein
VSDCFTSKRDELRLGNHFLYFFTCVEALEISKKVGGSFCIKTKERQEFFSSTFFPQKSSKKLGAGFKERRSIPEN